jgi:DNA-directed RNA polymerase specialized sigma subunit
MSPILTQHRHRQAILGLLLDLEIIVEDLLDEVSPRHRRVLQLRYGLSPSRERLTLREVGERFKVSRPYVHQLEVAAIREIAKGVGVSSTTVAALFRLVGALRQESS